MDHCGPGGRRSGNRHERQCRGPEDIERRAVERTVDHRWTEDGEAATEGIGKRHLAGALAFGVGRHRRSACREGGDADKVGHRRVPMRRSSHATGPVAVHAEELLTASRRRKSGRVDDDGGAVDQTRERSLVLKRALYHVDHAAARCRPAREDADAETPAREGGEQVRPEEPGRAGERDERRFALAIVGQQERQATDETEGGFEKAPDSSICFARVRLSLPDEVCGRLCGGTRMTDVSTP